jgi:hypothetical protein
MNQGKELGVSVAFANFHCVKRNKGWEYGPVSLGWSSSKLQYGGFLFISLNCKVEEGVARTGKGWLNRESMFRSSICCPRRLQTLHLFVALILISWYQESLVVTLMFSSLLIQVPSLGGEHSCVTNITFAL